MRLGFPIFVMALAATLTLAGCGQKKEDASKTYDLGDKANTQFLVDNKAKNGVKTTADGLQYRIIKSGHGKGVTGPMDNVTVTYKGWLISGKVFDQTQPGATATFPAGHLIPGWVEALKMMHEGDEWELVIPSQLGYGPEGTPDGTIPPNQTLVFDMTLISVAPEAPPSP
jgi:FKBP-type peptidyl-prolyl cis-trans isomerase